MVEREKGRENKIKNRNEKKNVKIKIWKNERLLGETDIGTKLVWCMMRYVLCSLNSTFAIDSTFFLCFYL